MTTLTLSIEQLERLVQETSLTIIVPDDHDVGVDQEITVSDGVRDAQALVTFVQVLAEGLRITLKAFQGARWSAEPYNYRLSLGHVPGSISKEATDSLRGVFLNVFPERHPSISFDFDRPVPREDGQGAIGVHFLPLHYVSVREALYVQQYDVHAYLQVTPDEAQEVVDELYDTGWFVQGVVADELNAHLLPDISEGRMTQVVQDGAEEI